MELQAQAKSTSGSAAPATKLTTQRTACASCHQRKIKCNANEVGFPCTNCSESGREECRPHQKRKRGAVTRTDSRTLVPLRTTSSQEPPTLEATHPITLPQPELLPGLLTPARSGDENETRTHLVEFIDQVDINERPIDRAARVTYIGSDAANLSFLFRQHSTARDARVLHHPANRIARHLTVYEPLSMPKEALVLPDRNVVDRLLNAYFNEVNIGCPIVDRDRFMKQYHARDPNDPPSLLLLQSIMVVGAHVSYPGPEREGIKATFYRRAKMLFDSRFERNRDVAVQAALLLAWHTDGAEDVAANVWYWIRTAATVATGLGMHRDAERSTLVAHNKRMWRRVFWLMFQQDVMCAMMYGRPQSIRLDECDVQPLRVTDFEQCGEGVKPECIIHGTELCKIISQALRDRFGPCSDPFQVRQALTTADEALAQWSLYLPDSLRLRPTVTMDFHPTILQLTYHTFLIVLHRPMPHSDKHDDLKQADAEICSAAAGVVQSLFEGIRERGQTRCLWPFSIHSIFTAMIQLSVEVRLTNPVLSVGALRRFDSTLWSLKELSQYWPNAQSVLHFFENLIRPQRLRNLNPATPGTVPDTNNHTNAGHMTAATPLQHQAMVPHHDANLTREAVASLAEQHGTQAGYQIGEDEFDWRQLFVSETLNEPYEFLPWEEWRDVYYQQPEPSTASTEPPGE